MKMTVEKSLRDFDFWCGAITNAKEFEELHINSKYDLWACLEVELEDIFFEQEVEEENINDLFRFDFEFVLSLVGYGRCYRCGELESLHGEEYENFLCSDCKEDEEDEEDEEVEE